MNNPARNENNCSGDFYALQCLKIPSAQSLGFFEEVRQLANKVCFLNCKCFCEVLSLLSLKYLLNASDLFLGSII